MLYVFGIIYAIVAPVFAGTLLAADEERTAWSIVGALVAGVVWPYALISLFFAIGMQKAIDTTRD